MGLCVGVDLGTTHSLISVFREDEIELMPARDGSFLTPSVVGLSDDGQLLIGRGAQARLTAHADKTFARFKRHMGTDRVFRLGSKDFSATDLSAMLLRRLKEDLEAVHKEPIESAVISVPAYFNSVQRNATLSAAELAGFAVKRLVNEPTAAALAYGLHEIEDESTFIVLDLGGGTFDVSILEMFDGVMEVRASSGDSLLGGEDFTEALAKYFSQEIGSNWEELSGPERETLIVTAEALKRKLSEADSAAVEMSFSGQSTKLSLTRPKFEEVCNNLLMRLRRPIERCLYDAGLKVDAIDRVILVGGATRMQMVRALAARIFQKLPERGIDPDLVVCRGAAVQAALSSHHAALEDVVMTDVAPFSLGVEARKDTMHGSIHNAFYPIIERNTILPASREQQFWTVANMQKEIRINVFQGESPIAPENISIGALSIQVPPAPAGVEGVSVRFSYDVSGLLQVEVKSHSTGVTKDLVITGNAASLSKRDKKARLQVLESLKVHPRDSSANQATLERLKQLYAMLLGPDREIAADLLASFHAVLDTQDARLVEKRRIEIEREISAIEKRYVL